MRTDLPRSIVVLALLWLAASACPSAGTQARPTVPVADIPPAMQADYDTFAINCSKCHALARALNAPVTDVKHWDLYVARMMRTAGSAISPSESPAILRFLYWYTREHNKQARAESKAEAQEPVAEAQAAVAPPESAPAPPTPDDSHDGQPQATQPDASQGSTDPGAGATTPVGEESP